MIHGVHRIVTLFVLGCFILTCLGIRPYYANAGDNAEVAKETRDVQAVQTEKGEATAVTENKSDKPAEGEAADDKVSADKESLNEKQDAPTPVKAKPTDSPYRPQPKSENDPDKPAGEVDPGDPSFVDRMFMMRPEKKKDAFDLDYAPSETKESEGPTPFYKHWAFWTVIGVLAAGGVVLGIKYGVDHSDNMSFNVVRRNP